MKVYSKKAQEKCIEILTLLKTKSYSFAELQAKVDIQGAMLLHLISYLSSINLIRYNTCDHSFYINSNFDQRNWGKKIGAPISNASRQSLITIDEALEIYPYDCPTLSNVTIKELSYQEYFEAKEFYDFEVESLLMSINWGHHSYKNHFLTRQFANLIYDNSRLKKTHIFIATQNNSVVGVLATSNYANEFFMHKLPCAFHEIFNVNLVATRKEALNQGIATRLVESAATKIFEDDSAYCLCYDPLIPESKSVMLKVFDNNHYLMHRRTHDEDDIIKYGPLYKYIITKNPECENENTI